MADNKQEVLFKLKIEENRALRSLKNVKKSVDNLDRRTTKYKNTVKEQVALESKLASIRKQRISINKNLEKSTKSLTTAQVQGKTAVGASTSATLELGRVLSDMPYGIRGVANNLQQLASNLFFMSKATDAATGKSIGFGGALKSLFRGLIGPAGILIAFQGVIAAFDYFSNTTNKAEEKLDNYGGAVAKSGSNLKILKKALEEGTMSTEEANEAVNKANSEYEGLNLKLDKNNQLTKDSVTNIDNRILALERLSKAQALQGLIEDEYSKIGKARYELEAKLSENNITIKQAEQKQAELALKLEGVRGRARTKLRNKLSTLEERQAISLLETFQKLETKGNKAISSLMSTVTEEGLLSDLFKGKKRKSDEDFAGEIQETTKLIGKGLQDLDIPEAEGLDIIPEGKTLDDLIPSKYDKTAFAIEQYKTLMSGLTDFVGGEFERQLTIEQNKTNVLNAELNQRLLNEKLSADERKNIQNQIAQNDEDLRKKQNKIKKKQFNTQKAFNIAMATADSYLAGVKVLADPFFTGRPWERAIAMTATIASGLASVTAIARQKFQPIAPSTPSRVSTGGGSSATTQSRQPIFNIVGRSSESQLAEVIQGQFNKPVKAYVVSKEVTTQQQLDLNIQSSASI